MVRGASLVGRPKEAACNMAEFKSGIVWRTRECKRWSSDDIDEKMSIIDNKRQPLKTGACHAVIIKRSGRRRRRAQLTSHLKNFSAAPLLLLLALAATVSLPTSHCAQLQVQQQQQQPPGDFQLIAAAQQLIRLPCLIGKQATCGEPYFIAWYKQNATSRQWARIEAKSRQEGDDAQEDSPGSDYERPPEVASWLNSSFNSSSKATSRSIHLPLVQRIRLEGWSRDSPTSNLANCLSAQGSVANNQLASHTSLHVLNWRQNLALRATQNGQLLFDCAQLSISALELSDEGAYKCEVTFSDSLDPERCPASTLTQLTVIGRPREPEILLNGRQVQAAGQQLTFKEGAQVRLECQSSGGKPAPRIEWLNLTSGGADGPAELQLMRSLWPIKRAHQQHADQTPPVSSSSLTITLSRFDLQSRFVCLVLAPPTPNGGQAQQIASGAAGGSSTSANELPASARDPQQLARQLDRLAMLTAGQLNGGGGGLNAPLIKWIKLDVLARPTSVSLRVLDVETANAPAVRASQLLGAGAELASNELIAAQDAAKPQQQQAFYALQPNRLYAIQCLVENSRPRSQVAWFNRTAPIELDTVELFASDYLLPGNSTPHKQARRLASFVRHSEHLGTYRTVATLLLQTNFYDNFEELFCRVSNEAFQFDELLQVAPILSARIYVTYPLSVWLEWTEVDRQRGAIDWQPAGSAPASLVSLKRDGQLQLRCFVGASPLAQNSIIQIEWLKDGRRLPAAATSQLGGKSLTSIGSNQQQPPQSSQLPNEQTRSNNNILIERANHLHMPQVSATGSGSTTSTGLNNGPSQAEWGRLNLLRSTYGEAPLSPLGGVGATRLLVSSQLTIGRPLEQADAALYSCQFKLIPAPSSSSSGGAGHHAPPREMQQQQQQPAAASSMKILSGQASQAVQLRLIEDEPERLSIALQPGSQPVGTSLQLNEQQFQQLLEAPATALGPTLSCQAPQTTRDIQFAWTFSSSAQSDSSEQNDYVDQLRDKVLLNTGELNLRQLLELRMRQQQLTQVAQAQEANGTPARLATRRAPANANLLESFFGNYTCLASSRLDQRPLGSISVTLSYMARPACQLELDTSGIDKLDEQQSKTLVVKCRSYSALPLLESILLRNGQPISNVQSNFSGADKERSPSSVAEFRLAPPTSNTNDLRQSSFELKCLARNSLGLSEACELSPAERRLIQTTGNNYLPATLNTPPLEATGAAENAAASFQSGPTRSIDDAPGLSLLLNSSSGGQSSSAANYQLGEQVQHANYKPAGAFKPLQQAAARRWPFERLDWLLAGACSLALLWFVAVLAAPLAKRRLQRLLILSTPDTSSASSSVYGGSSQGGHQSKWRVRRGQQPQPQSNLNTAHLKQQPWRLHEPNGVIEAATLRHAADDLGAQVGQVTQTSAHYEDFIRHQLLRQQQQQQQQSIYFNSSPLPLESAAATLSRRPLMMKGSLSAASSTTGSGVGHYNRSSSTSFRPPQAGGNCQYATTANHRVQQQQQRQQQVVPLITGGARTSSRIQLDQQQQGNGTHKLPRMAPPLPTGAGPGLAPEHIYDDVIYQQMIL